MMPMIAVEQATVRMGGKALVDTASLSFMPGEAVAIIGPNGAGKTTLLRLLSGELSAQAGRVVLKGRPIADYSPRELACHRAVLSQNIEVALPFTVADIVRMGASHSGVSRIDALAAAMLDEVGLGGFATRILSTLSGGEQQRAHFARVLLQLACGEALHGPGLLLLDEPTASLDLKHQIELLIRARTHAARGGTVIAVLHDLNLTALFAERVIVMKDGRIAQDGTPSQTITTEMIEYVFGTRLPVSCAPTGTVPFVLPQMAVAP